MKNNGLFVRTFKSYVDETIILLLHNTLYIDTQIVFLLPHVLNFFLFFIKGIFCIDFSLPDSCLFTLLKILIYFYSWKRFIALVLAPSSFILFICVFVWLLCVKINFFRFGKKLWKNIVYKLLYLFPNDLILKILFKFLIIFFI